MTDSTLADGSRLTPADRRPADEPVLPDAVEEAWYAEVQRRRRSLDAGEMATVPWQEIRAGLLADDP